MAAGRVDLWLTVAVLLLYLALVLTGSTTSSIGIGSLREDPSAPAPDTTGEPQGIRSDEFNVFSPIALSMTATGSEPSLSPLSAPAEVLHRYHGGSAFQPIAYFDTWLLRMGALLPDDIAFAAHWWLPSLLILLVMPVWFRLLGAASSLGWLAGALVVLAPANWWWSLQPSRAMAFTLAGCVALLAAHLRFSRGQVLVPVMQAVLAGVLLAGLPSRYIPWALLLGSGLLAATGLRVVTTGSRRGQLLSLGIAGAVTALVGLGALWEGRVGLEALSGTIYPGSRREGAAAQPVDVLLGAPLLGELSQSEPQGIVASELATAPNVAFLALAFVLAALPRWPRRDDLPMLGLITVGLMWLAWGMVDLANVGPNLPIVSLVTPARAVQVVGILGVIGLGLGLSALGRTPWHLPVVAAVVCGLATAYAGGIALQTSLPEMRRLLPLATAAGVALAVALLIRYPRRWFPVVITAGLAAGVVAVASPLQVGLGDLRNSEAARYVADRGAEARRSGTLWASDWGPFDALLMANGVPSLSGLQRAGPDREQWMRLDPDGAAEDSWNRGGGYLDFDWQEGGETRIRDDGFDVVRVSTDPCTLAEAFPELRTVASVFPLPSECLREATVLEWSGLNMHVYDVIEAERPRRERPDSRAMLAAGSMPLGRDTGAP